MLKWKFMSLYDDIKFEMYCICCKTFDYDKKKKTNKEILIPHDFFYSYVKKSL